MISTPRVMAHHALDAARAWEPLRGVRLEPDAVMRCERFGCTIPCRTCVLRQLLNERFEGRRTARKRGRGSTFPFCDERCSVGRAVRAALRRFAPDAVKLNRSDWAETAERHRAYLRAYAVRLEQLEAAAV